MGCVPTEILLLRHLTVVHRLVQSSVALGFPVRVDEGKNGTDEYFDAG